MRSRVPLIQSLTRANNYLEIGVANAATFLEVNSPRKTAVDPNFNFDIDKVAKQEHSKNRNTRFIATASDDFFANHAKDEEYDLIFIDGLHTWDQTYRDFCSSLHHLNENGVIVIDDTYPSSFETSLRERWHQQIMNAPMFNYSLNWMGDVYKMIPFLHQFHPNFELATFPVFKENYKTHTVLWKSKNQQRLTKSYKSIGNHLIKNYEELLINHEIMNFTRSDEELYTILKQSLGR